MPIPKELLEQKVPLSLAAGFVGMFLWAWFEFVHAEDFTRYQRGVEVRILTQQKQTLETEVMKLEVKQQAMPRSFTPVDSAMLKKQRETLNEVNGELKLLREKK